MKQRAYIWVTESKSQVVPSTVLPRKSSFGHNTELCSSCHCQRHFQPVSSMRCLL